MKHTYTIQQLTDAITQSTSIRQVLMLLNITPKGGNYQTILRRIKKHNICTLHFTGQGHNKGKQFPNREIPLSSYLDNIVAINSFRLKQKLLKANIFQHQCSNCKLINWLDNPIPLELDHIDGDNENNNLTNLHLLCPNCHAFTDTYRGKNQKKAKLSSGLASA
jgi:5-methylcytosine-specific restriction endonuclease McrA